MMQKFWMTIATWILARIDSSKPKTVAFYEALAKHMVSIAIDPVILRHNPVGKLSPIEVWLSQRGPNEAYPGEWHCPGSLVRPGERESAVFERVSNKELHARISDFKFCGYYFHNERRGPFLIMVFLVQIEGEPKNGKWWPVNDLPQNIIEHHLQNSIPLALRQMAIQEVIGPK